jgi:hypothetical protein
MPTSYLKTTRRLLDEAPLLSLDPPTRTEEGSIWCGGGFFRWRQETRREKEYVQSKTKRQKQNEKKRQTKTTEHHTWCLEVQVVPGR